MKHRTPLPPSLSKRTAMTTDGDRCTRSPCRDRVEQVEKVKAGITKTLQWWQRQRLARALKRYTTGMGGQLSGGIALTGLLSVAAALTIGLTLMVQVFRRNPEFRDVVFTQIDNLLPGVIDTGDGQGIDPNNLGSGVGWSITGVIAVLVLLNTATRV